MEYLRQVTTGCTKLSDHPMVNLDTSTTPRHSCPSAITARYRSVSYSASLVLPESPPYSRRRSPLIIAARSQSQTSCIIISSLRRLTNDNACYCIHLASKNSPPYTSLTCRLMPSRVPRSSIAQAAATSARALASEVGGQVFRRNLLEQFGLVEPRLDQGPNGGEEVRGLEREVSNSSEMIAVILTLMM
jgi:hypothetical protein